MLPSEAREVVKLLDDISKVSNTLSQHKKIVYATQHYTQFCDVTDRNIEELLNNIHKRAAKYSKYSRCWIHSQRNTTLVGKTCELCGEKTNLIRHHTSYDPIPTGKVIILCAKCHIKTHQQLREVKKR